MNTFLIDERKGDKATERCDAERSFEREAANRECEKNEVKSN
jgi:hypothetical protein